MFKGLFSKDKKSKKGTQEGVRSLSPAITSAINSVVGKRGIPMMAGSAQKAFKLSVDPNTTAHDFVEVIESDEAMSAKVIKIANSVYFERGKRSETIEECVNVLGVNELKDLLSSTTLSSLFPSKNPLRVQLWTNDIATAIAAKYLAEQINHNKKNSAFTAGLLHDIGKLLLLQRAEETYSQIIRDAADNERDFCGAEENVFVFNHTEVGQLIAEKWNFGPDLKEAIRYHHELPTETIDCPIPEIPLSYVIGIADLSAHALGLGSVSPKIQNRADEKLQGLLELVGIGDKRGFLQNIKRNFEMEKDQYLGIGN